MSYHQKGNNRQSSYYRQRITHPKFEPLQAWEKKFCIEVGAMLWERFVEAKKSLYEHDKVFDHSDNAKEMDWFSIPLEEIQAIGWDEYEEPIPRLPSIVGSP
ncbi:hypothetical protein Goshw_025529 [Gossypium schwendimanii]|uniref:Uncharacterized protein n=1 Tax=Gossypium schwendimanii TaxID=34291 RepID=A0A7J9LYG2_GOSSC|nr:hypothetical protein [Gossypium schwendimanii]